MFCVYILHSKTRLKYYVGQTNNIDDRLRRHNSGLVSSTKHSIPWDLVYMIQFARRSEAVLLERKIKKRGIRRYLIDINFLDI